MSSFVIQEAKSGRSSCKKCLKKIQKGTLRIGTVVSKGDYEVTSWKCVGCFALPRSYMSSLSDGDKEDAASLFVMNRLEDSDGVINDSNREEIIQAIDAAKTRKKKGGAVDKSDKTKIGTLKRLFHERKGNEEEEKGKSSKRIKLDPNVSKELEIFSRHVSMKNDELKDILGWNKQLKGGTKDDMLARIVDGEMNGRLGVCPLCTKGRIKLRSAKENQVECNGYFDEDVQARYTCSYTDLPENAPRLLPWYAEEPTEEEVEEMEKQFEDARERSGAQTEESATAEETMIKKVKKLDWKTDTKENMRAMVEALIEICGDDLDLPENKARAIGPIVARNKTVSAEETFQEIVKEFGFAKEKKAAVAKKEAALEASLKVPANAPVIAALIEMSQLYFKSGNRHGGVALTKVANALKELKYVITESNALKLGKGKTKVAGVGASSAKKIHEFMTTGTIVRLEELRAEVE